MPWQVVRPFVRVFVRRSVTLRYRRDVEWMYELRQSPLCPPRTYDLHSNDTIKFLVYYSTVSWSHRLEFSGNN